MKEKLPAQTSLWQTSLVCWHFQPFYAREASGEAALTGARHRGVASVVERLWQLNGQALVSLALDCRSRKVKPREWLVVSTAGGCPRGTAALHV
jgi:hypothetical protein